MPNIKGGKKRSAKKSGTGKKRKPSAYNIFMKQFFAKHKGEPVTKVVSMGAKEWKKLTDSEKAKYKH